MTDMERRKFEDTFKEAFDGAEVSPSENVWTNIELDLEKADGGKIRRRLLFYKLLAAASIAFALAIVGIGSYVINEKDRNLSDRLAATSSDPKSNVSGKDQSGKDQLNKEQLNNDQLNDDQLNKDQLNADNGNQSESATLSTPETSRNNKKETKNQAAETDNLDKADVNQKPLSDVRSSQNKTGIASGDQSQRILIDPAKNNIPENSGDQVLPRATQRDNPSFDLTGGNLPIFYSPRQPELKFHNAKPDPGMILLAKLAEEERQYAELDKKEKKDKSEKLWTSVGFAAGGFSAVNPSVSPNAAASNSFLASSSSSVPDKQANASGVAYSFGVSVGTKLSKRWVLQGGVNYLSQSSDYTATNVVAAENFSTLKAESINELDKLPQMAEAYDATKLAPTVPYSVNNNLQFFSLPVQAGYLLVNRKFGLQLNAGVSTDLFLQNTITPEGGSLDKTTQGRGGDSPYRSVNFSGLMGTELSYRIGQRYRIALNPGIRYPFNSVFKSDVGIESTPLTFDVGLRFRYIFH